jgi:hypothetical protein
MFKNRASKLRIKVTILILSKNVIHGTTAELTSSSASETRYLKRRNRGKKLGREKLHP